MMRFSLLLAASLAFAPLLRAQAPERVTFARGRTTAQVSGAFTPTHTSKLFVLRASAGQHMRIVVRPLSANLITAGTVQGPDGKSDGGPGGVIFDDQLSATGDYTIRIFEREAQVAGRFAVDITITGKP